MAMNEVSLATELGDNYHNVKESRDRDDNTYLRIMEKAMDVEFQRAKPTMTNVDITTPANTLYIALSDVYRMANVIATAVCTYWSKAIQTSGIPAVGLEIVSVTNDAMSHIKPLEEDILRVYYGKTINPAYSDFSEVVLRHVRNIEWTVTETNYVTTFTLSVKVL